MKMKTFVKFAQQSLIVKTGKKSVFVSTLVVRAIVTVVTEVHILSTDLGSEIFPPEQAGRGEQVEQMYSPPGFPAIHPVACILSRKLTSRHPLQIGNTHIIATCFLKSYTVATPSYMHSMCPWLYIYI
jgi:hypothetical protein